MIVFRWLGMGIFWLIVGVFLLWAVLSSIGSLAEMSKFERGLSLGLGVTAMILAWNQHKTLEAMDGLRREVAALKRMIEGRGARPSFDWDDDE